MDYYNGTYQSSVVDSFQSLWYKLAGFLPNLLAAIIVLIVGWLIAVFLGKVVYRVLAAIKIDSAANRLGLNEMSARVGRKLSVSAFGEWLVKWFFLILVFLAASDILGLTQVSVFLYSKVFPYFGNVVAAVAILLIGMLAANFLSGLVRGTLKAGEMGAAQALASVTRWSIMIFAILAALSQLNVAAAFLQYLFIAIVAMLAIAGGLAFGLGGREHAKRVLDAIEKDLTGTR